MRFWMILLCTLCATQAVAAAAGDRDSDVAATVRSLERSKFDAQQNKDAAVLNAIFDDGLMWVDQDGALSTKAGFLEGLRNSSSTQLRIVPDALAVTVFDGIAVVVGIYDETGMRTGRPYHRRCRFIDSWAFKRGKWMCIAATATSTIKSMPR